MQLHSGCQSPLITSLYLIIYSHRDMHACFCHECFVCASPVCLFEVLFLICFMVRLDTALVNGSSMPQTFSNMLCAIFCRLNFFICLCN